MDVLCKTPTMYYTLQWQWLVRGALPMSFPAVWLRTPLGAGLLEKYHASLLLILRNVFDVVFLDKELHLQMLHLTRGEIIDYLVGQGWQCLR